MERERATKFIHELLDLLVKQKGSDLFITADFPPAVKVDGKITPVSKSSLTPQHTIELVRSVMNDKQAAEFESSKECNFAISPPGIGRFRVNAFVQQARVGMVLRTINTTIPKFEDLGLPPVLKDVIMSKRGIMLFVGATGCGKSTSMAALLGYRNENSHGHIITIEDPIEFVHQNNRAIVVQQEVLTDVHSFNRALIHVLRQDPDVIVVGEVRDAEAIATVLTAAETGHLVLATMHSPNVAHALERITGIFEGSAQRQVVLQLANSLQGIIAQDLLPSADRTRRVLAYELMMANNAVRNLIRENQLHFLENTMQTAAKEGMVLMDNCLYDLYCKCAISYDTAMSRARHPDRISRKKD